MPLPRNLGYIVIEDGDVDAARFWLRVFNLEPYVTAAQADIAARPEVGKASVPIIAEHRAGRLYFYYAIILFIDPLGLSGAIGMVTFSDEGNRKEAEERRNALADHIFESIQERVAEGKMSGVTITIPPGKE